MAFLSAKVVPAMELPLASPSPEMTPLELAAMPPLMLPPPYISMMSRSISSSLRRLTDHDSFALVIYYDNIHDVLASHGEPEYDNDEVLTQWTSRLLLSSSEEEQAYENNGSFILCGRRNTYESNPFVTTMDGNDRETFKRADLRAKILSFVHHAEYVRSEGIRCIRMYVLDRWYRLCPLQNHFVPCDFYL